jgi:hypothetical protein
MKNFEEKIRPRIVFDLTIHREIFYLVDAYTQLFVPAIIIVKNTVECNTNHIQADSSFTAGGKMTLKN